MFRAKLASEKQLQIRAKAMWNFGQKQWENLGKSNEKTRKAAAYFSGKNYCFFPNFPLLLLFPHFPLLLHEFPIAFARITHCFCPNFSFSISFWGAQWPPLHPPPPPPTPMMKLLKVESEIERMNLNLNLNFIWIISLDPFRSMRNLQFLFNNEIHTSNMKLTCIKKKKKSLGQVRYVNMRCWSQTSRHTPWLRVRCHGCWLTHQFHSRRHSLRIILKYTTLVRMRRLLRVNHETMTTERVTFGLQQRIVNFSLQRPNTFKMEQLLLCSRWATWDRWLIVIVWGTNCGESTHEEWR